MNLEVTDSMDEAFFARALVAMLMCGIIMVSLIFIAILMVTTIAMITRVLVENIWFFSMLGSMRLGSRIVVVELKA